MPQSPTVVIMMDVFDLQDKSWMSVWSASDSLKPNTFRLSAVCSVMPNLAPITAFSIQLFDFPRKGSSRAEAVRTYDDSSHKGVVQHPARGDVGDTQPPVTIPDRAKQPQ